MKNKKVNISIDGKEYISLSVPDGAKVTIEDGVTVVEPEKYIPKVGDCMKLKNGDSFAFIKCHKLEDGVSPCGYATIIYNDGVYDGNCKNNGWALKHWECTKITPEGFQAEFKKLGYLYDFETNTAVKIRWRAEYGCEYWYVDINGRPVATLNFGAAGDFKLHNCGNYFKTEQLAKQCAEIEKDARMKFHNSLK